MAFHILTKDAIPFYLTSGCEAPHEANNVLCGANVGERRSAIAYDDAIKYENNNKLNFDRLCKACLKKFK